MNFIINKFKNIVSYFLLVKLMNEGKTNYVWYKVMAKLAEFATGVQQHGKPMLCKIATVDLSEEKIIGDIDIVSIWAGCGDANPIERLRHLKDQNNMMKDQLRVCMEKLSNDEDTAANIQLMLTTFE